MRFRLTFTLTRLHGSRGSSLVLNAKERARKSECVRKARGSGPRSTIEEKYEMTEGHEESRIRRTTFNVFTHAIQHCFEWRHLKTESYCIVWMAKTETCKNEKRCVFEQLFQCGRWTTKMYHRQKRINKCA